MSCTCMTLSSVCLSTLFQAYLHSMSIIHRDLNSHNCLVKLVGDTRPEQPPRVVKLEQLD